MPDLVAQLLELVNTLPVTWGLVILGSCAMIEYLFPPFPGDMVVVTGAVLIPTAGWPWWGVFGVVMAGSMVGAMSNWWLGRWLLNEEKQTWVHAWFRQESIALRIEAITAKFERWGVWVLVLSRFIPAFRSLFFVAAGMAKFSRWKVALCAGVGGALWNICLLGVGSVVGYNLEAIGGVVGTYSSVVITVIVVGLLVWFGVAWRKRRAQTSLD